MEEEYFTVDEVAEKLKVTRAAVYKWMKAGRLAFVYVGDDRRITSSALKAFIRPGRPDGTREPHSHEPDTLALASAAA